MHTPTVSQLQRSLQIAEQIAKLQAEMEAIFQGSASPVAKAAPGPVKPKKGTMSAKGRANIVAAQKKRWAKIKSAKKAPAKAPKAPVKKKRRFSPAVLQKLRDAMKKRWALAKAGKAPAPTASKNKK